MKVKEVVFISGKGGAGKTSIMAALSQLAQNTAVLADADVDAANLFLLTHPVNTTSLPFYGMDRAFINPSLCNGCGLCQKVCQFDALNKTQSVFKVQLNQCEGCARCVDFCPTKAITMAPAQRGEVIFGTNLFQSFLVYGSLLPGQENSGKLVTQVREKAKEIALKNNISLILIDGPPGIGCPAIAATGNTSLTVLICEATLQGFHDAQRALEILKKMNTPVAFILNKTGLSSKLDKEIKAWIAQNKILLLGEFPFSKAFIKSLKQQKSPLEVKKLKPIFQKIYKKILDFIKEDL